MAAQTKPPQDLSPDLKQIYDRVMNAPTKGGTTPPPPSQPSNASQVETPKTTVPQTPSATTPPATNQPTMPPVPTSTPPTPPATPNATSQQEPFLTSAAPRPLQGSVGVKSFSIGKDDKNKEKTVKPAGEKKGMSKALIIILVLIFFGFWTFFWIVFFFNPFG